MERTHSSSVSPSFTVNGGFWILASYLCKFLESPKCPLLLFLIPFLSAQVILVLSSEEAAGQRVSGVRMIHLGLSFSVVFSFSKNSLLTWLLGMCFSWLLIFAKCWYRHKRPSSWYDVGVRLCSDSLSEMLAAQFVQCGEYITQLWLAQLQQSQLVLLDCWHELESKITCN